MAEEEDDVAEVEEDEDEEDEDELEEAGAVVAVAVGWAPAPAPAPVPAPAPAAAAFDDSPAPPPPMVALGRFSAAALLFRGLFTTMCCCGVAAAAREDWYAIIRDLTPFSNMFWPTRPAAAPPEFRLPSRHGSGQAITWSFFSQSLHTIFSFPGGEKRGE